MKRFMYFSIGMLCLSIAVLIGFHLGSQNAVAQSPAPFEWRINTENAGTQVAHYVMLSNGDIYAKNNGSFTDPPRFIGNFFAGGPLPTSSSTWGSVKSTYAPKKP